MLSDTPRSTAVPGELRVLVDRLVVTWRDQLLQLARPSHAHLATSVSGGDLRADRSARGQRAEHGLYPARRLA